MLHNGFAIAGLAMLSAALVTSAVSAPLPTQSREFGSSIILKVGERGSAAAAGAIMGGACLAPLSRERLLKPRSMPLGGKALIKLDGRSTPSPLRNDAGAAHPNGERPSPAAS